MKTFLTKTLLPLMLSFTAMMSGVRAEDAPKADKPLDTAPAQPLTSQPDSRARDTAQNNFPDGYLAQRLGAMQKSTQLAGVRILDRDDMPLGKVTDLLISLHTAKIYCALVSVGDPSYTVAAPGLSFLPADNGKVIMDINKAALKSAPRFSTADWDFVALRKSIGESYAYFNQKPLWDEKSGLGQVNKGKDFIGMEVRDKDDQSLGKVQELMVDLPTARVVYVIVSFDSSGQNLYAVPPQALMLTSDNKMLFLDETKSKIQERAHQSDYFWTEMTERAWAANTYRSYGIEPDFDTGSVKADPTREQVRAKVEDAPVSKAAGKSDAEITRMVLTAMIQEDMNSAFNHKNIKINTVSGHVTLAGHVKNEKQKDKLGQIAEDVVGTGFVDNQLELK
jgi:sporulation protein YlmC with PRC-barrel domain